MHALLLANPIGERFAPSVALSIEAPRQWSPKRRHGSPQGIVHEGFCFMLVGAFLLCFECPVHLQVHNFLSK